MLLLFGIAFAVKLLYIKLLHVSYYLPPDGILYSNIAENLNRGQGFVNTVRNRDYVVGPIYPLLLAFIYALKGSYAVVIIVQAFIGALTVVLAYVLGEELFGKKYALVPYGLMLIYPGFSFWGLYVLTETTYVFVITLFLYLMARYAKEAESPVRWWKKSALYLGLIIGLSNLVRPLLLLFLPVLFVWIYLIQKWKFKQALRDFTVMVIMIILVMSPWWIRNFMRYQTFIAVTNYGAYELYAGNNPYTDTHQYFDYSLKTLDPEVEARVNKLPVQAQEKEYSRLAKEYILDHPVAFMRRTLAKEVRLFWLPIDNWYVGMPGWRLDKVYLFLGYLGAIIALLKFRKYSFLLFTTAYYSIVVSMITIVSAGRYRLPIMPAVIFLDSLAIIGILNVFIKMLNPKSDNPPRLE